MNTIKITTPERQAAVNGLAVVGFIALVVGGIWFAVSAASFVPDVANRIGAAAVYLGSIFTPAPDSTLAVVPSPTASTTISFGEPSPATSVPAETPVAPTKPVTPTAGAKTSTTVNVDGAGAAPTLFGNPDLLVTVSAIGYLTSASTDAFVPSATVPSGERPAVKFTIKNVGTNVTGPWRFSADIPTRSSFTFRSDTQLSLNPGDSIDYTLGFDRAKSGTDQAITITADFDNSVTESAENNNSISANLTIGQ